MMSIADMTTDNLTVFSTNTYDYSSSKLSPSLVTCHHEGEIIIPSTAINLYTLTEGISDSNACDTGLFATDYTGFAAVVDGTNTDDTLLYAITNATHAVFAVLTH